MICKCEWCGKEFSVCPSRMKAEHICCSRKCAANLKKSLQKPNSVCPICGKHFYIKPCQKKDDNSNCCSRECLRKQKHYTMLGEGNHQYGLKGDKNSSWKSDEKISRYGYRQIRVLDHPFRDKQDFVLEHRLVAEKYLLNEENKIEIDGKFYLRPEYEVHHKDMNRLNNNPDNLMVLTHQQHRAIHNVSLWRELLTGRVAKKEDLINMTNFLVRRATPEAKLPTKSHEDDAGWDLYAIQDYTINPHETVMVDTGICVALPKGTFGAIYARSGLATKQGLRPANCVGVCDAGYRNNYMVALHNDSEEIRYIKKHDRIAQLIIQPFVNINYNEVETLDETDRGNGGFGSTGTN